MSEITHNIKRHNHRIHPCMSKQKEELLKHLVELHQGKSILLISSANTATSEIADKNMTISHDAGLDDLGERQWDIVISYDLPQDPQTYQKRLTKALTMAVIIDDGKQQQELYDIETLQGKNLSRDVIKGFEPTPKVSTYIGDDENGKAKFSGKTKDRNHRYDGTPKTNQEKQASGKKRPKRSVTVKSIKPKSDEE